MMINQGHIQKLSTRVVISILEALPQVAFSVRVPAEGFKYFCTPDTDSQFCLEFRMLMF